MPCYSLLGHCQVLFPHPVVVPDHRSVRGAAHGPGKQRPNLPLQHIVGRQTDGILKAFGLQELVHIGACKSGVCPVNARDVSVAIAVYYETADPIAWIRPELQGL